MKESQVFGLPGRQRLLLIILVVLPYLNSLNAAFVFDDDKQITNNATIESFSPFSKFLTTKRPLIELSLACNYAISGQETWSYHLFNLTIHVLASLLLFAWLSRLLPQIRGLKLGNFDAQGLAFAITLLWAVHPVQTETVTYAIQRAEGLASFFYLAGLFCWLRAQEEGKQRLLFCFLTGLSAWLGMMSKSIVITLPIAILLQDYFILDSGRRKLSRTTVFSWLWLLSAGLHPFMSGLLKGVTRGVHGGKAAVGFTIKGLSAWDYMLSQCSAVMDYLFLIVAPFRLCLDHGRNAPDGIAEVLVPAIGLLSILACVAWGLQRRRPFALGMSFFFLVLSPTSSVIPIRDIFVEHRIYLAMLGPLAVLVITSLRFMRTRPVGLTVLAILYVVFSSLTALRNDDYSDEIGMWRDIVKKSPENPRGHYSLGVFDAREGLFPSAIRRAERAIALDPDYELAWVLVASSRLGLNQPIEAEQAARQALAIDDDLQIAYTNLGDALFQQNRIEEAIAAHRAAIKAKKKFPSPHVDLAEVLLRDNQPEEAWASLATAFECGADRDPRAWQLKAVMLRRRGDFEEAVAAYQEALVLRPDSQDLHLNLAIALQAMGQYEESRAEALKALQLDANSYRAHLALASLEALGGDFEAAISNYERAETIFGQQFGEREFPAALSLSRARLARAAQKELAEDPQSAGLNADADKLSFLAEVRLSEGKREEGIKWLREAFAADPALSEDLDRGLRFRGAVAALELAVEQPDSGYLKQALLWLEADLALRSAQIRQGGDAEKSARSALFTWMGHQSLKPLWQPDSGLKEKGRRQQLAALIDALLNSPPG